MDPSLFSPLNIGHFETSNRVVMAPMTRGRAQPDGTPTDIMATYYRQRASAGLIITEGTFVSAQGVGWVNAPGIYTDAQQAAWRAVTEAVHDVGGRIFLLLWHMGRVSHPDFQADGALPVGPSAVAAEGDSHTPTGRQPYVTPRALDLSELPGIVDDFRTAAARAVAAGFDGVEIHGANGYLVDQFIRSGANHRGDEYGGPIANRWRFPLEVVAAIADEVGAGRTAIRLSTVHSYNSMSDSDPVATFSYGAEQLDKHGLAYVHVVEGVGGMMHVADAPRVHPSMRRALKTTPLILNGGYEREAAQAAIADGQADAISFGATFLANPDLVARLANGVGDRNAPDFSTLYSPGEKGYTDYPAYGA